MAISDRRAKTDRLDTELLKRAARAVGRSAPRRHRSQRMAPSLTDRSLILHLSNEGEGSPAQTNVGGIRSPERRSHRLEGGVIPIHSTGTPTLDFSSMKAPGHLQPIAVFRSPDSAAPITGIHRFVTKPQGAIVR
jgi:hypothetical protein